MPKRINRTNDGYECDGIHVTSLAPRESQVLLLRALGFGYQEIAEMMNCSINAVKARISNLFYKLNATSSPELIMKAFRSGHLRILSIAVAMLISTLPVKMIDHKQQMARLQRPCARNLCLQQTMKVA